MNIPLGAVCFSVERRGSLCLLVAGKGGSLYRLGGKEAAIYHPCAAPCCLLRIAFLSRLAIHILIKLFKMTRNPCFCMLHLMETSIAGCFPLTVKLSKQIYSWKTHYCSLWAPAGSTFDFPVWPCSHCRTTLALLQCSLIPIWETKMYWHCSCATHNHIL